MTPDEKKTLGIVAKTLAGVLLVWAGWWGYGRYTITNQLVAVVNYNLSIGALKLPKQAPPEPPATTLAPSPSPSPSPSPAAKK